ncbi:hypothetical protein AJ80_09226 [Polytolypa hystricis UAMH7299]|uniref:Vacuolar ATPase assembly protein VMA22 n=1 Tax=Polytolypa hystricis (strain UAMH7299) TaxID=1447883 RepID=A0A2B7WUK6_POLH7|nr:hypothetical protein AJ80_09226 [Polytolypa hystricis UAMH7299]
MSQILPTPPASPAPKTQPKELSPNNDSSSETAQILDTLLERYLNLLDKQQQLQEELGRHFSAGFFSLARANNSCPPGRRYGEDYYDERMKAVRKISIAPSSSDEQSVGTGNDKDADIISPSPLFTTISVSAAQPAPSNDSPPPPSDDENPMSEINDDDNEKPDPSDVDDSGPPTPSTEESTEKTEQAEKPDNPPTPSNPLRWFGILVPPALRQAQASFISAVETPIPALAGVVAEMRDIESKVGETRARLAKLGSAGGGKE